MRNDARADDHIHAFLGLTPDNLKGIADYLTGPGGWRISPEMAREAIDSAKQFVECVAGLLPSPPQPDRSG